MDKKAQRVHKLFDSSNAASRVQWEYINQKGFDFSNDNQLTDEERISLQEQGMPDFTINRIIPVVEMLNFYATANQPRWQAVAAEGSDTDVAALFSDIADYIWYNSDGTSLYANSINDAVTKSVGYMMVTVDPNADRGMGEVTLQQPDPFDVYIDPKARDVLFRDAAFIMIRKVLPRNHLKKIFPDQVRKINNASPVNDSIYNETEKNLGKYRKDFSPKDITDNEAIDPDTGEQGDMLEFFEVYEATMKELVNVFVQYSPDKETMKGIQQQVDVQIEELTKEMSVQMKETELQLNMQVQSGAILPERAQLELEKKQKEIQETLEQAKMQFMSEAQSKHIRLENLIMTKKEFADLKKLADFNGEILDSVPFYAKRIQQTCVIGDKLIYQYDLPDNIQDYPIVPFHYKWTGTPFPISAVSPLVGKQREINKSHQLMVHNASLGSSLRWMYEEGSVDTDYWEKYSSSPGALLPIRPGSAPPTPVQPAALSNAFFTTVAEAKGDMEYLAGIYSSMQGETGQQHETYRGMLAMDEYGTRRIKQWMNAAIEPALKQLGQIVKQFSQAVYTAHKVFRIVQPNNINEEKMAEINIPLFNDFGEAIGKWNDYATATFDIRVIAGSTLPINRWAYLDELKQLLQLGVVDDVAVLAETDIRNKPSIVKRKSLYAQLTGQIQQLDDQLKDSKGTIETLERQLVQAGIKQKVMAADVEINKNKEQVVKHMEGQYLETEAQQKLARGVIANERDFTKRKLDLEAKKVIQDLQKGKE